MEKSVIGKYVKFFKRPVVDFGQIDSGQFDFGQLAEVEMAELEKNCRICVVVWLCGLCGCVVVWLCVVLLCVVCCLWLCCVVLCCVVLLLCCVVLCCVVLCCAVLCCAVLCCAVLCCAVLCCCCAVLCCAVLVVVVRTGVYMAEHLGASSRRPRHPFPALMAAVNPGPVHRHRALPSTASERHAVSVTTALGTRSTAQQGHRHQEKYCTGDSLWSSRQARPWE